MAPKKKTTSSHSPIQIGNCEVTVQGTSFSCSSEADALELSFSRNAKIKISVRKDLNEQCSYDARQLQAKERVEEGRSSNFKGDYDFVLVNSKDADAQSKCYLQEVLKLYAGELPAMNYAANTGKQSMFLERCVSNGKYSTLLLKSESAKGFCPYGEVIAAITYQIVPADTQYAEVPLAAVSSMFQHKGFGRFLYTELRKRLQSVGIHTIYCWGDEESEGFWLKQGFTSIAEVDRKGKARRLPIKAHIRKALCYPGGSTLMVCHVNKESSANPLDYSEFCLPIEPHKRSSLAMDASDRHGFSGESYSIWMSQNKIISMKEGSHCKEFMPDGFSGKVNNSEEISKGHNCGEPTPVVGGEYNTTISGVELANIGFDTDAGDDVKVISSYRKGTKKRAWEASISSLKSKKVKGTHQMHCDSDFICALDSESDRLDPCFNGCSLGISRSSTAVEIAPMDPLTCNFKEDNGRVDRLVNRTSETQVNKEIQSKRESFRIMLMNIADDTKKRHLTKVIETLGGSVTPDGSVSTHIVTGKVRTTRNFCTALCLGCWVVSPSWLKESFRKGRFVDELPYVLYDEEYVLKHRIELKDAVLRAKERPGTLLKGYNICIATYVQPPLVTLSAIVIAAGGTIIWELDEEVKEASKTIFIACEEEMEEALSAAKKGVWTFSSEWLMNCIMRQELDLEAQQFAVSL